MPPAFVQPVTAVNANSTGISLMDVHEWLLYASLVNIPAGPEDVPARYIPSPVRGGTGL
jgi:hypothetical protein